MSLGVQGQQYVVVLHGLGKVERNIYIPSYQLNISENGTVFQANRLYFSVAAKLALNSLVQQNKLSDNDRKLMQEQVFKAPDKIVLKTVQVPKDLLDKINMLYKKRVDEETPVAEIASLEREIKQLILASNIFI